MLARPAAAARTCVAGLLAGLLFVGVLASGALVSPARADSAPLVATDPTTPTTVSADPLPTVQINGVAWSQVVVGNTVYVAGKFTSARPAGAAAGTSETPRNNLLAYDIRTGALLTSFAPSLNAQALVVAASPDGSRIYVGGDFTTADGQSRSRIAAYSTATGALITTFRPTFSSQVRAIVATNDTVYVGGNFAAVGGVSRTRLAAVSAANGALLPWAPVPGAGRNSDGNTAASYAVNALALTLGNSQVVVGGRFGYLNSVATSGVGAVDAVTGATKAFAVGQQITNQGDNSSINSVSTDGTTVWLSGYDFYGPGNLEGAVSARADGGGLIWMADCHGDTYSTFPQNGSVYIAGHPHQCQNIGGFPETDPRLSYYGLAYTQAVSPRNTVGNGSFDRNFVGSPAPEVTNWYPRFYSGTYTGQGQAGWSVTGNSQYVVYGGEFPAVNNTFQQGLVRFAVPSIAPNKVAPTRPTAGWAPTVLATEGGTVRVSWPTVSDRDNQFLTYSVFRNGAATPVYTSQPEDSTFFRVRTLGFRDVGLPLGSSQRYQVRATDPFGNVLNSDSVTTTVSSTPQSAYAAQVRTDGATGHWPLEALTGTTSYDQVGFNDVTVRGGVTIASGSPTGRTSAVFDGSSTARATVAPGTSAQTAPDTFSLELWFSTTSTSGGRLAGFGNSPTGDNGAYDRMLMMDRDGRLSFGVYTGATELITSRAGMNDGTWHHVVAELSPAGQTLFVDGFRVGTKTNVTAGQPYTGWWQLGGGSLGGWPVDRATDEFSGQLSQVAVYPAALSQAQVRSHFTATGRSLDLVPAPTDAYGAAVAADQPSILWRLDDAAGSTRASGSDETGAAGRVVGDIGRASGVTLPGTTSTAYDLAGRGGYVVADKPTPNPTTFSTEVWFNTTTTNGGRLIGLGNSQGASSGNYDRFVYMVNDGRLRFGVWAPGEAVIDTPLAYNDGEWHHVVATMGPNGMSLYVDGALVGTHGNTSVVAYDGSSYWRLGADTTWGGANTTAFDGRLDEAAVYDRALTAQQVAAHWSAAAQQAATPTRPTDAYGAAVYDASPSLYWRMGDTSGTVAASSAPQGGRGTYTGSPTLGAAGPQLAGVTSNTAVAFDGVDDGLYSRTVVNNPTAFTTELWFNTTTTRGGKLVGFGDRQSGLSGSYDRHVYLEPDGRLTFGAYNGNLNLVQSAQAFNDGRWHHVAATMGADGMRLYVDGVEVGANPNVESQPYSGYWRVGGDSSWSGDPYAAASIDEVAVYGRALTSSEVAAHWTAATGPLDTPPTAAFTSTSAGLSAAFDGTTSSDSEGPVRSWAWDFGDGSTGTGSTVSHRYGAAGTYQVTLTVTDGAGKTATTTKAQTVTSPPNQPPLAGFTATTDDLTVAVDGTSSSDTDGTVAGWAWTFGDGATATTRTATHTYAAAGTYTVGLTVTDDRGATATAQRQVTVTAPNQAPVSAFTSTASDLVIDVDGTRSTDADGSVRAWAWDFGDGATATGNTARHTYTAAGSYVVGLTVTDDRGATSVSTQTVTVTAAPPPNRVPTASFTATVNDLSTALDAGTSVDADGIITGYAWAFGDGTTGTGRTTTHAYGAAGTYSVTLTVTDDKGATGTSTSSVTVTRPANVAPTAAFTVAANGLSVALDASGARDSDGTITAYSWDFGDGTTGTGRTTSHVYGAAGTFPVTLTVTDDRQGTASVTTSVTVTAVTAQDAFGRTVTSGWGTADLGGAWTTTGTATVGNGAGVLTAAPGRTSQAVLAGTRQDSTVQATVVVPQTPTGGGTYVGVVGRRIGTSDYRVQVVFRATGAAQAVLVRVVNGVETTLGTYAVPGSQTPGTALTVRLDLSGAGSGTTTLRARVWVATAAVPAAWNLQASDTTAALQAPGTFAVNNYVSGSATAPSTVRVDDVWVGATGAAPAR